MADEVRQEIQEGKEQEPQPKKKLLTKPIMAVVGGVVFVLVAGVFVVTGRAKSAAQEKEKPGRQDPEKWLEEIGKWRLWDLGTVWVTVRGDLGGEKKISAKFSLLISRELFERIRSGEGLLEILKSQVRDLIQSILDSRQLDVKNDPKRARLLLRDDVLRGLKMGANPNDPHQKTYQFPFNEENLAEVFVEELQITRW